MDLKPWNEKIKRLRYIILKPESFEECIDLCLELHSMVHSSKVSCINAKTFEDELFEGLEENTFRTAVRDGHTIAYNLWHTARIEDITMNLLVAGEKQVFNRENWKEKINTSIIDTGNAMTESEVMEFSNNINIEELINYRMAVGRRTREIIRSLKPSDMKRKVNKEDLGRILDEGAVVNREGAKWLIDFWGRKNTSGIILMPVTRHHVVHINESLVMKKKYKGSF